MRQRIVVLGAVLLASSATLANAEVNCKFVMKNLQTGRTVEEVAQTMVIGEDEVRKCQEEAAAKGGGEAKPGEAKPTEEKK